MQKPEQHRISFQLAHDLRAHIRGVALLCLLFVLAFNNFAIASDWTSRFEQRHPHAKLISLKAKGEDFYAVRTPALQQQGQAQVIVVHGNHQHPLWPHVVDPLRQRLPLYGWYTLAVEVPELSATQAATNISQALEHLEAANTYLQDKQQSKEIILLGYGSGARLALEWISKNPIDAVKALVLISMSADDNTFETRANQAMLAIKIPVLEIIAEHDSEALKKQARIRNSSRRMLTAYRQMEIYAADPYYSQQEDELIKRIRGWLKQLNIQNH